MLNTPWDKLPSNDVDDRAVVFGLRHQGCGFSVSDLPRRPLSDVLDNLPPLTSDPKAKKARTRTEDPDLALGLLKEHPWLQDIMTSSESEDEGAAASGADAAPEEGTAWDKDDIDVDHLDKLLEKLEYAKEWVANADDYAVPDWRRAPRGGKDLIERKGVAFDTVMCAPKRDSLAEQWAKDAGMGAMTSFAVVKFGASAAKVLAGIYGHKCQWYYDQFLAAGRKRPAAWVPYEMPAEFDEILCRLHDDAKPRALWLRNLEPR